MSYKEREGGGVGINGSLFVYFDPNYINVSKFAISLFNFGKFLRTSPVAASLKFRIS